MPQPNLNGRSIVYPRGYILGGSSSVSKYCYPRSLFDLVLNLRSDYNIATRGSSDEFDRIANITGDPGWNWANMLTYAKKVCLHKRLSNIGSNYHILV